MVEIPGFHVKYAGFEVEFYSQDATTVANEYRNVLQWLQKTVDKTLSSLESQIIQLKKDMAEIKQLRKEA